MTNKPYRRTSKALYITFHCFVLITVLWALGGFFLPEYFPLLPMVFGTFLAFGSLKVWQIVLTLSSVKPDLDEAKELFTESQDGL